MENIPSIIFCLFALARCNSSIHPFYIFYRAPTSLLFKVSPKSHSKWCDESYLWVYQHILSYRDFLFFLWVVYKKNMEGGDIETNPGPINRLSSFCTWNLNSIYAHDFIRFSLLEAYNTVYSDDLIGIVETHLDGDIDIDKLNLNGYNSINSNYPQNAKRGGLGLYIKESFPCRRRSDLEILPECIVCEFHINRSKYFF